MLKLIAAHFLAILLCIGLTTATLPPAGVVKITGKAAKQLPQFHETPLHRGAAIPECFDARKNWPKCKSIADIRNQGNCGTCWAVSTASVVSDRLCIASGEKNQTFISAVNVATCTDLSRNAMDNCLFGNDPANAYKQMCIYGAVSGGNYDSKQGCLPYPVKPMPYSESIPLTCSKSCSNGDFKKKPEQDTFFIDTYWTTYTGGPAATSEQIKANVKQMQTDLMTNGPITSSITTFSDLENWKPETGAYRGPSAGAANLAGHAIRLIGWCKDANKVPYWMVANSWGTKKGDKGIYWIEMGKNVVGIEDHISAPIISMPNTCPSICEKPIDQIVRLHPKDAASPVYAFQGDCVTQIKVDGEGKITPVGKPEPLGKRWVGAPTGPIKHWMFVPNPQEIGIAKNDGTAGICYEPANSKKVGCRVGRAQPDPNAGPQTLTAAGDRYVYYTDAARKAQIFKFPGNGP
ncbi:cathepsin B-like cysteine proteinase 4 [Paramacrobiotus metropolitanus]|uniref:cathepsin B-like cysteine proteinase 4 n=1 Tax=Paramacrobiotus metropolitanus TaxID=2943436 RepID=UPI002445E07C|nr:cathepsin B-like cysteine proteinase 4 [Paramacrobiotus metropolitanus]